MKRSLVIFWLLVLLISCGAGGRIALQESIRPFLVRGAKDIQVSTVRWNEWQIRYYAPGSPTTWHTDVSMQLETKHWNRADPIDYGGLNRTYSRRVAIGFGEVWEWAFLTFEPSHPRDARILVRRWLALPGGHMLPLSLGDIF
jgi:hypothetical protein